jgi:poly(hydroxyalkanoate) depolymerase family esterase
MRDQMESGMAEATRLTREGRLAEATALIQRALGGTFAPASPDSPGSTDQPVEYFPPVVEEAPQPTAPSGPGRKERALRQAPRAPRRFRDVQHRSGNFPGTMPGSAPDATTPDTVSTGGQFVERSYSGQAGGRAYKLYIPSGYTGQAVPLIVMLHGCTQNPDDLAAGTRMNTLAEVHTFLVAYPAQAAAANNSKCWNWFKPADQQRGRGEPSIIAGITREVVEEYHVAADRVYVAGMSAGGAMAAIMGAAYPDLYAAIGVHSGLAPGAAHDLPSAFAAMQGGGPASVPRDTLDGKPARLVPAILFHGDRDTTVHPRNGDHLLAHFRAGNTAGGRDVRGETIPRVTEHQGRVPGGYSYTCATYHDAGGRAVMEQWTVQGLGHAWSGGSRPGSYTDPKGPDASAEMVRFFHQAS